MGLKISKKKYMEIIEVDLESVNEHIPEGLTKDHINLVLCNSIDMHYPKKETTKSELVREELEKRMPSEEDLTKAINRHIDGCRYGKTTNGASFRDGLRWYDDYINPLQPKDK